MLRNGDFIVRRGIFRFQSRLLFRGFRVKHAELLRFFAQHITALLTVLSETRALCIQKHLLQLANAFILLLNAPVLRFVS